jgi:NTP pyrophosphatase (non-canonical NTP hydrolase)
MKTETLEKAIDTYGLDNQLNQLQEECAELIVSVNKIRRCNFVDLDDLVDELADVTIMMEQIINHFNLEIRVHDRIQFKLNRLKERLENENKLLKN